MHIYIRHFIDTRADYALYVLFAMMLYWAAWIFIRAGTRLWKERLPEPEEIEVKS